jgi:hypothetical protein
VTENGVLLEEGEHPVRFGAVPPPPWGRVVIFSEATGLYHWKDDEDVYSDGTVDRWAARRGACRRGREDPRRFRIDP